MRFSFERRNGSIAEMERIKVYPDHPHGRIVQQAVEALNNGDLVIYPTDTVYGIGCSIYKKQAMEKLYRLKGKSKFVPMSVICASIRQAAQFARIDTATFRLLRRCFPGPFTVILPATRQIPRLMLSRRKEVGIRIPDSRLILEIVEALGHPLLNSSIHLMPNGVYHELVVPPELENAAALMLDAGPLPESGESTILRILNGEVEIVREGKGEV
ncbi:MAG: threonylcarbamoyl-AMP synthase, partial [Calditrichaeota bacterium]